MISGLRRSIAVPIALLVTLCTLGRVRVEWSGGPGAADQAGDPGRAAVARGLEASPGSDRAGRA